MMQIKKTATLPHLPWALNIALHFLEEKQVKTVPGNRRTFQSAVTFDVLPSTDASYLTLPARTGQFVRNQVRPMRKLKQERVGRAGAVDMV